MTREEALSLLRSKRNTLKHYQNVVEAARKQVLKLVALLDRTQGDEPLSEADAHLFDLICWGMEDDK